MKLTSRILSGISATGPKIRKELKKTGCKFVFRFKANLESILSNNKSKLLPNS